MTETKDVADISHSIGDTVDVTIVKVLKNNPIIGAVAKNCSVKAGIKIGEGGALETEFTASCSPTQTAQVLSELEGTEIGNSAKRVLDQLGVESGRCGVEASVSSSGGMQAKASCPAPQIKN